MGTLRPIQPGEAALFAGWEKSERPYPWTADQFELKEGSKSQVLVWEENGQAIGFAVLQLVEDEAYLLNIMIDPQSRRKGHGSALLQKVIINAKAGGASQFLLDVDIGNKPAVGLYQKAGFKHLQRRYNAYPHGEDALMMVLNIEK